MAVFEVYSSYDSANVLGSVEAEDFRAAVVAMVKAKADLYGADLRDSKADLYKIFDLTPHEVPGLLSALRAGKINGSAYHGVCACLVGTIGNLRGVDGEAVPSVPPDSSRPAERLFLALRQGDTPANHGVAKIVETWIEEWLAAHPDASPKRFWRLRDMSGVVVGDGFTTSRAAHAMAKQVGAKVFKVRKP